MSALIWAKIEVIPFSAMFSSLCSNTDRNILGNKEKHTKISQYIHSTVVKYKPISSVNITQNS